MRTGLSLARGGGRVLKWTVLFGVVFAVGAGSASAQITVSVPETVEEGRGFFLEFTAKYRKAPNTPNNAISMTLTGTAGSSGDVSNVGRVGGLTAAESNDYISPPTVTFTTFVLAHTGAAAVTGTLRVSHPVRLRGDRDAEDEEFRLTFSALTDQLNSFNGLVGQDGQPLAVPDPVVIRIEDDEEQTFEWETPDDAASPREGTPTTRTLKADPAPDDMVWNVALFTEEAGYVPSLTTTTFTSGAWARTITITPPDNDGNREDDTIELRAFLAGTSSLLPGIEPLEIEFPDVHALPEADKITAQAYEDREGDATGRTTTEADSVTEGGDPVHVRVTIDRGSNGYPSGEKLIVRPRPVDPAQRADYRIEPNSIEVPTGNGKRHADFVLYARPDDDVGDETLALNLVTTGEKAANGPGEVVGTFSIDVVDATTALIAPAAQAAAEAAVMEALGGGPLNPGDSFTVDTNDLFNWAPAAVDAAFAASVRGAAASASVSGTTVTVEAKEVGDAVVTVTATGTARGSSAVSTSQTVANAASVTFDVQVDEVPLEVTVTADPEEVAEGAASIFTATANRPVTGDTTITLTVVPAGGLEGPGSIVIPAGEESSSVTLTAPQDDDTVDESVSVVAAGAGIPGSRTIPITVADDDTLSVELAASAASVEEGGAPITLTATADLAVLVDTVVTLERDPASTAGEDDYTAPASITILAGSRFGAAELTFTDDLVVEDDETLTLNARVGDVSAGSVTVTVTDDDVAATYTLSPPTASVEEGGRVTLTVTADPAVRENTVVTLERDAGSTAGADDYRLVPARVVILAGESSADVTLRAEDDAEVEGDETLTLNARVGDVSAGSVTVTVTDNDVETTYDLSASAASVEEGGTVTLTATASQAVRADTVVTLTRDAGSTAGADDYLLTPASITIPAGETSGAATLTAADDPAVEGEEKLTLNARVGGVSVASVTVTVTDDDVETTYGLSPSAARVEEGGTVTLTATADPAVRADTVVTLERDAGSTAGADDYRVAPASITIPAGETSGAATLTATDDYDVEGDETLMLNARVGDVIVASTELTVADDDRPATYRLSASADSVEEGGMVTLTLTADPAVRENTEVTLERDGDSTAGADDYRVAPARVVILAGESSIAVELTATDDAEREGGETLTLHARVGDVRVASVTLAVADDDDVEITYTLSGPADMNVVEGGKSAEVTATASPAVPADTTVELVATGGDAGAADYSAAPIVIGAGETTGTTLLMAVDDGLAERSEELTLEGRVGGMKTNALTFTLWDAAVPALPVAAQLLLAAFLAVGGCRRYLRRR